MRVKTFPKSCGASGSRAASNMRALQTIWSGDRLIQETPLYTAEAVGAGPLHSRALDALGELLFGWL